MTGGNVGLNESGDGKSIVMKTIFRVSVISLQVKLKVGVISL